VAAVLELDVHPDPELLGVEAAQVDADHVADAPCLLDRCSTARSSLSSWLK
jgi:hypothetical protein